MLSLVQTLLSFLFVLTLVVTVHELGHFLAAKAFGVAIDRFSIGFGKTIASWTDRAGVEWRVAWAPLGGYVRFAGDENAASVPDQEDLAALRRDVLKREGPEALQRYFHFKPLWQRAIVVAAGPMANFLLAIALFAVLYASLGQYVLPPRVQAVTPGSPAEAAGFRAGDYILRADGERVRGFNDIAELAQVRVNLPTRFLVKRGEAEVALTATPKLLMRPDGTGASRLQGTLGLTPFQARDDYKFIRYSLPEAVAEGAHRTWGILKSTVFYLGRMITGQVSTDQLGGPLRIAQVSGQAAEAGAAGASSPGEMFLGALVGLLGLAAVLSVGIGFMNLLPVPVLDGGHLLFYAYEAMARKPLEARVQAAGYRLGLALVLGLMLFATWNDLQQLRVFKILGGLFS